MSLTIHTYYGSFFWPLSVLIYLAVSVLVTAVFSYIIGCRKEARRKHLDASVTDAYYVERKLQHLENEWRVAQFLVAMAWPIGIPAALFFFSLWLIDQLIKKWETAFYTAWNIISFPWRVTDRAFVRLGKRIGCGDRK